MSASAAVKDWCKEHAVAAVLLDAYDRTGEARPSFPIAYGLGLGVEPPLIGTGLPSDDMVLTPGTVLAVGADAWAAGVGGVRLVDTLLITEAGPERLSR